MNLRDISYDLENDDITTINYLQLHQYFLLPHEVQTSKGHFTAVLSQYNKGLLEVMSPQKIAGFPGVEEYNCSI